MIYIILVGLGGGLGALARYSTGVYIQDKIESKIPLHTLFINVLGSFLLAYVYSHFNNKGLLTFMATGFLGGFTTFSTFIVENLNLVFYMWPLVFSCLLEPAFWGCLYDEKI